MLNNLFSFTQLRYRSILGDLSAVFYIFFHDSRHHGPYYFPVKFSQAFPDSLLMASQTSSFGSDFFFCEYWALGGTYISYHFQAFHCAQMKNMTHHSSITMHSHNEGWLYVNSF
jgi:hypothetical protein